jgi:probable rRNA maturation factor
MSSDDDNLVLFRRAPQGLSRRSVKQFAHTIRDEVAGGSSFCCLVTDDRELRRLNRLFRKKDYATDVLSFPATGESGALGEIAISGQRARDQASDFGHSLQTEVELLMLHGLLHLLGFDHETDRGRMARMEANWRTRLGLPAGLIERARP